jgi:hypothetical protein
MTLNLGCRRSSAAIHHAGLCEEWPAPANAKCGVCFGVGVMIVGIITPAADAIGEVSRCPAPTLVKLADPDPIDGLALSIARLNGRAALRVSCDQLARRSFASAFMSRLHSLAISVLTVPPLTLALFASHRSRSTGSLIIRTRLPDLTLLMFQRSIICYRLKCYRRL